MAYYNSNDIENYLKKEIELVDKDDSAKLLTPLAQPLSQLKNEEDLVGFFYTKLTGKEGKRLPKMSAKVFYRIDKDLYTDDRFAIDLFQASKDGLTVSEVIKNRHQEHQKALRELTGEDIQSISKIYERTEMDNS